MKHGNREFGHPLTDTDEDCEPQATCLRQSLLDWSTKPNRHPVEWSENGKMTMSKFADICKYLAARRCHDSGQTIKHISKSAGVSVSTVRRWIRITTPS